MRTKSIVLHSSGLDSTACLLWALREHDEVIPVFVDYGQSPREEELVKRQWEKLGIEGVIVRVPTLYQQIGSEASMLGHGQSDDRAPQGFTKAFLPNRNLLLLMVGHNICAVRGCDYLMIGVVKEGGINEFEDAVIQHHQTITSPFFPDSTVSYMVVAERLLNEGGARDVDICMPFCAMTKWEMLHEFDEEQRKFLIEETSSCNEKEYSPSPASWGYGCGKCAKCLERQRMVAAIETPR